MQELLYGKNLNLNMFLHIIIIIVIDDIRRKTTPGGDHRHSRTGGVHLFSGLFTLHRRCFYDSVRHQLAVQLERPEDAAQ